MKADMFSLIQWNDNLNEAPTDDVLIIYKDDSGDSINYYTTVAWKVEKDIWIADNDKISINNIMYWAELPKYEEMRAFK